MNLRSAAIIIVVADVVNKGAYVSAEKVSRTETGGKTLVDVVMRGRSRRTRREATSDLLGGHEEQVRDLGDARDLRRDVDGSRDLRAFDDNEDLGRRSAVRDDDYDYFFDDRDELVIIIIIIIVVLVGSLFNKNMDCYQLPPLLTDKLTSTTSSISRGKNAAVCYRWNLRNSRLLLRGGSAVGRWTCDLQVQFPAGGFHVT